MASYSRHKIKQAIKRGFGSVKFGTPDFTSPKASEEWKEAYEKSPDDLVDPDEWEDAADEVMMVLESATDEIERSISEVRNSLSMYDDLMGTNFVGQLDAYIPRGEGSLTNEKFGRIVEQINNHAQGEVY